MFWFHTLENILEHKIASLMSIKFDR